MNDFKNCTIIANHIHELFGDKFTERNCDEMMSIYRKFASVDASGSGKCEQTLDIKIGENFKCIGFRQDLYEFLNDHFADGNSLCDSCSSTATTEWIINSDRITCSVQAYYDVSCAGHSGGVENIENSQFEDELSKDFTYINSEITDVCWEYMKEATQSLTWIDCIDDGRKDFYSFLNNMKEHIHDMLNLDGNGDDGDGDGNDDGDENIYNLPGHDIIQTF